MSIPSTGRLDPATQRRIQRDFDDLRDEFGDLLGRETVERCLNDSLDQFAGAAQVPTFIPLLVHRFARQQLRALAQSRGLLQKAQPEVLFVDAGDAGRSQIAAALLEHHAPGVAHIRTAGTNPEVAINPTVTTALTNRGLSLADAYPKPLTAVVAKAADVVVTLGCPDAVDRRADQRRYDWDVSTPDRMDLAAANTLCDEIDAKMGELLVLFGNGAGTA
jgi:protein-tyrosine-phosphatase